MSNAPTSTPDPEPFVDDEDVDAEDPAETEAAPF